jgi:O-antigen ligase
MAEHPRISNPVPALLVASLLVAIAGPALLAYNEPPSSTFLNQALALAGWCLVVAVVARWLPPRDLLYRGGLGTVWWAIALLMVAALLSPVWAALPWGLSLAAAGVLVVAGIVASAGAAVSQARRTAAVFHALAWALVLAGLASSAVAAIQLFAPAWADGTWIARSTVEGRAVGNLRQANHLASLLVWSAVAVAWLTDRWMRRAGVEQAYAPTIMDTRGSATRTPAARRWRLRSHERRGAVVLVLATLAMAACMAGMVFSGSRTGWIGAVILALWGVVDRRLSMATRGLLVAAPLMATAVALALASAGASASASTLLAGGGLARGGSDISSSRFGIWANTLELIAENPLMGVGFGEFNFAWTLTPFAERPVAFFDHAHNLPLHLLAELGVPLATVVLGLLTWALWQAFKQARRHEGEHGVTIRAAFVMVLLMGVHSQLEYPLWYAHFLLPTAFAWGLCVAGTERRHMAVRPDDPTRQPPVRTLLMAALLGFAATVLAVWDYQRVVAIFKPEVGAVPLDQRVEEGRQSWLFAHHADYAAVTTAQRPSSFMPAFDRAAHHLLDARLMRAWAIALDETNQIDRSRHVAQRLAEFRNPAAAEFFQVCAVPPMERRVDAGASGAASEPDASAPPRNGLTALAGAASGVADFPPVSLVPGSAPSASGLRATAGGPTIGTLAAGASAPVGLQPPASWVEMAASFPAPVRASTLPKGPPTPPTDPAFTATAAGLPFQCLKPNRSLSFKDFR